MNKVIVLIDMDDTIENLVDAWCKWLNHKHGTNVYEADIIEWDICTFFPELTKEEVFEPTLIEDFWKTVQPKKDAPEYISQLIEEGFEIYICTASDYRVTKAKYEYIIKRYFPFIDWEHVIIAHNKQMIRGDILIDDGIHNLIGGAYEKLLMTHPHNKHYDAKAHGMTRIDSWEEAYNAVHEYASKLLRRNERYESN